MLLNGLLLSNIVKIGPKLSKAVQDGPKWSKRFTLVQNCLKLFKFAQNGPN